MASTFATALATQFNTPVPNPQLPLIKFLKDSYPNAQHLSVVQCSDTSFPLSGYLGTINITPSIVEPETHCTMEYDHGQRMTYKQVIAGVTKFTYASTEFHAYKATWMLEQAPFILYHLVFEGNGDSIGQELVSKVYQWANNLKEEMWVFEDGRWNKSKQLYKAVRSTTWDTIVLKDEFREGLRRDTQTFFSSQEIYGSLGITWKRGVLLLGPPGNGKTESIKALLNEFKYDALYVKSFVTPAGPEYGVRAIFAHARKHSPCILVLEDLDAMVTENVRSFFLNELDGLAQNDGILTIATTNHPERIDDAIVNRPSRFDVKYNFSLPDLELRKAFADKWLDKIRGLGASTGVEFEDPEKIATAVAEKTDTWSFAFLKELFVSFLLRMAHDRSLQQTGVDVPVESADVILLRQIDQLATQIIKTEKVIPKEDADGESNISSVLARQFAMNSTYTYEGTAHAGTNF